MTLTKEEVNMCSQALGFMNAKVALALRDRMNQWLAEQKKKELEVKDEFVEPKKTKKKEELPNE